MNKETAIRIAALHDGEVSNAEKKEIVALLERDPEAKAYWNKLKEMSDALKGAHLSMAENSAHWENLKKRLDSGKEESQAKILHFPRYATAAAAILALGMGIWLPMRKMGDQSDLLGLDASVYMVETDLENATPIVYIDEPSGWTVVWVVEELPEQG
jgi:anti-sigma factor RsiW